MARFEFAGNGKTGTVKVDGHDISKAVRGAAIDLHVENARPEVTLELNVHEIPGIDVEDARVVVADATREALVKLGWTPPQEQ